MDRHRFCPTRRVAFFGRTDFPVACWERRLSCRLLGQAIFLSPAGRGGFLAAYWDRRFSCRLLRNEEEDEEKRGHRPYPPWSAARKPPLPSLTRIGSFAIVSPPRRPAILGHVHPSVNRRVRDNSRTVALQSVGTDSGESK